MNQLLKNDPLSVSSVMDLIKYHQKLRCPNGDSFYEPIRRGEIQIDMIKEYYSQRVMWKLVVFIFYNLGEFERLSQDPGSLVSNLRYELRTMYPDRKKIRYYGLGICPNSYYSGACNLKLRRAPVSNAILIELLK